MSIETSCGDTPQDGRLDDAIPAAMHMRNGKYSEALPFLQKALIMEPDSAVLLSALGLVHSELGDNDKALACYEKCLAIDSRNPVMLNMAGVLNYKAGKYSTAEELLEKALEIEPQSPNPLYNLGLIYLAQGETDRALEFFDKAFGVDPTYYKALLGKSSVFAGRKQANEVADCLRQALLIVGAETSSAAGNCEKPADLRWQEALLQPNNPGMLLPLGGDLCAVAGKLAESIEAYNAAMVNNARAHIQRAETLLSAGDFENGWKEYEWRIKGGHLRSFKVPPDKKRWDGSRMENGNLLILCEQGHGDAIQFSRYLPMAKERSGANITLVCRRALVGLFKNSWERQFVITDVVPPSSEFDCHFLLMSLPWLLGTVQETIPPAPYLKAAEKDIQRWLPRVSALKGRRVGISWAGSPSHIADKLRSITFDHVKPLFDLRHISFVSLQKGEMPSKEETAGFENFHDWGAELTDFADTAALVSCLDLVISVDTAVAHLSGALGKNTWTLIPFIPEWRWMRDTESTPWYPSMRLIRQHTSRWPPRWPPVIGQLADELRAL